MAKEFSDTLVGSPLDVQGNIQQHLLHSRIFDQMSEALVFMDPELTIRFANQSFFDLFGYSEEEIVGQSIRKLGIHDSFAHLSSQEIARILRQQKCWQGEVLRRTRDGIYIPVLVTSKVAYDEHGEFDGYIGTYLDLRQIRQSELRIRNSLLASIIAMARSIEQRDVFSNSHLDRVNELCVAIALELGKDTSFIEGLSLAAVLHDIGKIYIPSDVLNYSGELTESEMKLVKTHPTVGHDIMKDIDLPWPVADIILQHHERLDGSGYPNQLQSDEILFGAKILAVADVVESMYADRPFRRGYHEMACLAEIEKNRGILYEKDVVDACLKIFRQGRYKLKRH